MSRSTALVAELMKSADPSAPLRDDKGQVVVDRKIWGTRMAHRRSLGFARDDKRRGFLKGRASLSNVKAFAVALGRRRLFHRHPRFPSIATIIVRNQKSRALEMIQGRVAFTSTTDAACSNPLQWLKSDEWFLTYRIVIQIRPQPTFDLLHAQPLAFGVVFHLIAVDLAQAEVAGFRVSEVEAAYA